MRVLVAGVVALLLASVLSAQLQVDAPGDVTAVLLINGAQSVQMKNSMASSRRLFGIAPISSKQYFALSGAKAAIRTTSTTPVFQFEVDPAFSEDVYLFRFDVHSNKREIRVARGHGGLVDFSIPKDHLIPITLEEIGVGANATKRYRMKPTVPLRPGEYCLGRSYSCFDFGVD